MSYTFSEKEHVHKLNGKNLYGTTTILSIISKPLTFWASGMACAEFGWLNPKKFDEELCESAAAIAHGNIKNLTQKEYRKLLDKAYRAHASNLKKTASEGTDLHAEVETWIKWKLGQGPEPLFVDKRIEPFILWAEKNVRTFLACEANCYSERLWVGGKFDFMYLDFKSRVILADVKSSRDAYFSHFCQSGAYDLQIQENGLFTAQGERIEGIRTDISGHAIFPFGNGFKEPVISYETQKNKDAFEAALTLYKLQQSFENKE